MNENCRYQILDKLASIINQVRLAQMVARRAMDSMIEGSNATVVHNFFLIEDKSKSKILDLDLYSTPHECTSNRTDILTLP